MSTAKDVACLPALLSVEFIVDCRFVLSLKSTRTPRQSVLRLFCYLESLCASLEDYFSNLLELAWLGILWSWCNILQNTQSKFRLLWWAILYHHLKTGTIREGDQVLWRYISNGRTLYHSGHFLKIIAIQLDYESAVIKSYIVSTRGQIIHFAKVSSVLAGMQWLFSLFWVMHVTYRT